MVLGRDGLANFGKTYCVTAAYCVLSPFEILFVDILHISSTLAAGRSGRVIGRGIVLQKLIHRLQRLVVLIEDLQVLHRG